MGSWQEIEHTADLALRIWGDDLRDLFASAAKGMFTLVAEPVALASATGGEAVMAPVRIEALDAETLLVDWLNELLYLHEKHDVVFVTFEFETLTPTCLSAVATGRSIADHRAHIKATTFHNLRIDKADGGYATEVVFDV